MKKYLKKLIQLIIGLFLYALGLVLCIYANIGLAPWDAFGIGVSKVTGISYGNVSIITGILILVVLVLIFKEKIGFGTIFNTILIGAFADLIINFKIIPYMTKFFSGIIMLLAGQIVICYATYLYIDVGLCSGPRDTLMVALGKRFPNIPIGLVKSSIEGTVLLIGWLLGAKVGLGTIIYVFSIGFTLQTMFKLLKFDVKSVVHESVFDTVNIFKEMYSAKI
ncbi:MAG: hypothetical protein GX289_01175 [Tissierellia bacterium]|jgi:uncharacterized membrane protein YczE|nr:hypothetical protein [Tissierellia bacterium]